jgi:hypothetical protein
MKNMKDSVQLLIDILFDRSAKEDEREDTAIDLGQYNNTRALEALIKVASDPDEDTVITEHCAESIGQIFVAMNKFNELSFAKLVPFAQRIVFNYVIFHNSEIINEKLKLELSRKFH